MCKIDCIHTFFFCVFECLCACMHMVSVSLGAFFLVCVCIMHVTFTYSGCIEARWMPDHYSCPFRQGLLLNGPLGVVCVFFHCCCLILSFFQSSCTTCFPPPPPEVQGFQSHADTQALRNLNSSPHCFHPLSNLCRLHSVDKALEPMC